MDYHGSFGIINGSEPALDRGDRVRINGHVVRDGDIVANGDQLWKVRVERHMKPYVTAFTDRNPADAYHQNPYE